MPSLALKLRGRCVSSTDLSLPRILERRKMAVVTTSHGREEVGNETRSDRVKHCRHRDEGTDERQNMETDEPDG